MNETVGTSQPDPSYVEDLIARYLERRQAGGEDLESFCRDHTQYAAAIREGVADLEAMGFIEATPSPDASERPRQVGRYSIHGELGRGGMGVVYLGRDPRLGRWLAVKRLPATLARHPDALGRFEREARLLAALDHPNVGAIYSLEDDDHGPFLTLGLIRGETLAERLARTPLSIDESVSILRQIAVALEAAHASSIIHRDLKPQNVKVDEEGNVKVLDFGLAKALRTEDSEPDGISLAGESLDVADEDPPSEYHSRAGMLVGTPGYMSPEQIRVESVDERTDLFSWGCLAFECVTGRPAFEGEDAPERLARTIAGEVDLSILPAGLPVALREIIAAALANDRDDRPETAVAVRRVLDDAAAQRSRSTDVEPSESSRVGNVPEPWTPFVGRRALVEQTKNAFDDSRLVTLVGPGGAGKTRLSIEYSRKHHRGDSVGPWWIDLAPTTDPDGIVSKMAAVVETREAPGRDPQRALIDTIGGSDALMIVDNCEHLLEPSARVVATLLAECPGLRVLATSREALGIVGEGAVRVTSLSLPDERAAGYDLAALRDYEAVLLFEQRAVAARPGLKLTDADAPAVFEICRRLDGLPLAIELAAARLAAMSVSDLAKRLSERLHWLTGRDTTREPRQRALHSLVDWSHELLSDEAAVLFRRFSVFAGGASLEAIEDVCGDDRLKSWAILDVVTDLVEKSLIELEIVDDRARYRMLETLREFAGDRLSESDERAQLENRHARYFAEVARGLEPSLDGSGQAQGFDALATDRDNLERAIEGALSQGDVVLAMAILRSTWKFYSVRGHWTAGRRIAERLLESVPDAGAAETLESGKSSDLSRALAPTYRCAGLLAMQQGDYDVAEEYLTRGLELERELGDRVRIASSLNSLAQLELRRARYAEAQRHFEENLELSRELGTDGATAMTLAMLGNVAQIQGDIDTALPYFEESLVLSESLGNRYLTAGTLHNLAACLERSDPNRARDLWVRALELNRELGNRAWEARNLISLGLVDKLAGRYSDARRHYASAVAIHRELGDKEGQRDGVMFFGMLAAALGQHVRSIRLLAAAQSYSSASGLSVATGPQSRVDSAVAELQSGTDAATFAQAWAHGSAMSIDAALDYALDE